MTIQPGFQITFDAVSPHAQAAWWSDVLGYDIDDGDAAVANDRDGVRPRLYFQAVPEAKTIKNRLHLDLPVEPEELEAEVARMVEIGAAFVTYGSNPGHRWAVMQDPEGNEFCLH